jgi:hypothetical protein
MSHLQQIFPKDKFGDRQDRHLISEEQEIGVYPQITSTAEAVADPRLG